MILATINEFSAVTKFGTFLSGKTFEFSIFFNKVFDLCIIYIYTSPNADKYFVKTY